jgi:hypothetical protein
MTVGIKRVRWEWLAIAVVVIAGFVLAFTGYQHGLPFIDYPDEMTMWTRGRATIDPTWDMFQPEYPPGMVWLSAVVQLSQRAQGEVYINPAEATRIGRITSVIAFTITLAFIMLLTRELLTDNVSPLLPLLAALIAGLLWMFLPLAVRHARYAMPDCWLCMGFTGSLLAAVLAWKRQSERWLWVSLILGIVATLFKWQAAIIFLATGVACLRFWSQRRQFVRLVVMLGIIVSGFSLWVIFVRHALEGGLYMPGTTPGFPTPLTVLDNIAYQSMTIAPGLLFGLLPAIALILLLYKPARQSIQLVPLLMLPMLILALDVVLSINGSRLFPRHYLPALALLAVLAGVGIALFLEYFWKIAEGNESNGNILRTGMMLGVLLFIANPLSGMVQETLDMTREQLRPDRRVMLMNWIAVNALDHPVMVTDVNLAAAVDPLYGYHGPKVVTPEWGAYIKADDVTDEKLQSQNIHYLVAAPSTAFKQLKTQLTPIITNGDDLRLRGETWTVYTVGDVPGLLPQDQYITFGDNIQLRGFAIEPSEVCAGQSLSVHLAWSAIKPPQRYYAYFLHLANSEQGELSTPINGQQPAGDNRPTITWTQPDELLIAPTVTATVDSTVPPGTYDLWLGLFEPEGSDRLYLPDGKHYAVVGTLMVKAC